MEAAREAARAQAEQARRRRAVLQEVAASEAAGEAAQVKEGRRRMATLEKQLDEEAVGAAPTAGGAGKVCLVGPCKYYVVR